MYNYNKKYRLLGPPGLSQNISFNYRYLLLDLAALLTIPIGIAVFGCDIFSVRLWPISNSTI